MMEDGLVILGLGIASVTLAVMLWSIAVPARRIWPPEDYTPKVLISVWVPTLALFAILIVLGILGWGEIACLKLVRFGLGIPLIAAGNLAVWYEVGKFGLDQTSGAEGSLRMQGLYQYSRHPQYVADVLMVSGWLMLSASVSAIPVGISVIVLLFIAPSAEEPWLRERYGSQYDEYASRVRRYI